MKHYQDSLSISTALLTILEGTSHVECRQDTSKIRLDEADPAFPAGHYCRDPVGTRVARDMLPSA